MSGNGSSGRAIVISTVAAGLAVTALVMSAVLWGQLRDTETRAKALESQVRSSQSQLAALRTAQTSTADAVQQLQPADAVSVTEFRALQSGVASMLDDQIKTKAAVRRLSTPQPVITEMPQNVSLSPTEANEVRWIIAERCRAVTVLSDARLVLDEITNGPPRLRVSTLNVCGAL